jgi:hypothetical protein
MNSFLVSIVFAISIYATSALYAQVKGNQLALEPGRPLVEVQFESLGHFQATEQSRLLVLRLSNNLRAPIVVRTGAFNPDGTGEIEHGIIDHRFLIGAPIPEFPARREWIEPPVVLGLGVGGVQRIGPGESFRFVVPWNHVGPDWSIEFRFSFDLPAKGRQPEGVVAFTWDEVPARVRDAWRVR